MKTLTIKEAITQGYTHWLPEGGEFCYDLDDEEELQEYLDDGVRIELVEKEPYRFQVKPDLIREIIIDHIEGDELAEIHAERLYDDVKKLTPYIEDFCNKINPILKKSGFTSFGTGIYLKQEDAH